MTKNEQIQPSENNGMVSITRDLMIFRLIIVTAILGMGILIFERSDLPFSLAPLYALIIASYIITLIFWLISKTRLPSHILSYIQIISDIVIETGFVYFTGGITSQFTVLYGLSILYGSFFFQLKGGLAISTLASISYALLATMEHMGKIPRVVLLEFETSDFPVTISSYVFLKVYLHVCFFYLLAFLSGFLAERAKRKGKEATEAQKQLKQIRLNTDDILENLNSGLITVDEEGRIVSFNKAAKNILGCCRDANNLEGKHFYSVLSKDLEPLGHIFSHVLEDKQSTEYFETTLIKENAPNIPIAIKTSLLHDEDGSTRGVIALIEDLTDFKKMEERIRRSDRLAAVGQLSAGIAHEIRNPLASISGSIQCLQDELTLEGSDKKLFDLVIRESSRLNKLVDNFLYFARLSPGDIGNIQFKKVMDDVLTLVKNNPNFSVNNVDFDMIVDSNFKIIASYEQMVQMLLNLFLNALQAMNYEGELSCRAYKESDKNIIMVRDSGKGMSPEVQKNIFDPFYTTRKGGTGLGLAIVYRIVENHRGEISFESKPNQGTTFKIQLPQKLI